MPLSIPVNQLLPAAHGIGVASSKSDFLGDWVSLREGDSSITRANRNEVAKNYKSLATETRSEIEKMVQSYLKFRATPQQVVGDDTVEASYYGGITSLYDGYRGGRESLL